MEIKDIQLRIVEFAKKRAMAKNFEDNPELTYIHLTEELGEIARQLTNKKMRPDLFNENNLREEIVDIILESLVLAHQCNVDLDYEINKKIEALFQKHGFTKDTNKKDLAI